MNRRGLGAKPPRIQGSRGEAPRDSEVAGGRGVRGCGEAQTPAKRCFCQWELRLAKALAFFSVCCVDMRDSPASWLAVGGGLVNSGSKVTF